MTSRDPLHRAPKMLLNHRRNGKEKGKQAGHFERGECREVGSRGIGSLGIMLCRITLYPLTLGPVLLFH